jgi:hypothetical protein
LAFGFCQTLSTVYFNGNAPAADPTAFIYDTGAVAYYLPAATGWTSPFAGIPAVEQDRYAYLTNAGSITIARYTWGDGDAIVPDAKDGLPVVAIGDGAFFSNFGLTSVTIPASVTSIGDGVFEECGNLTAISVAALNPSYTSVDGVLFNKAHTTLVAYPSGHGDSYAIPTGVTTIGSDAFFACFSLTNVAIPATVTAIGNKAFQYCENLSTITIPASVTSIGSAAFDTCFALATICFQGNAPTVAPDAFSNDTSMSAYYLPDATGWSWSLVGIPTVLWNPHIKASSVGLTAGHDQFGFTVTGTANILIAVSTANTLTPPAWSPVQTVALTNGVFQFIEPVLSTNRSRFYRLSFP